MKKLCLLVLLNFLVCNAFAQNKEHKEYFDNNVLKVEGFKNENGIKTGEWKTYHENGKLKDIGNFLEGLKTGEWKSYDKNGKLIGQLNLDKKLTEERPITEQIKTSSPKLTGAEEDIDTPFSIVENVPIYPGCEKGKEYEKRQCMAKKIAAFVNENYNAKIAKELGLSGRQRIHVIFKIDVTGNIVSARARSPHPELEIEAVRVINLLPKMKPGTHKGKAVIVPYSLPIMLQVQE